MEKKLLQYYDQELAYLRHGMQAFAEQHPLVAAGLNINVTKMEDPHLTRLLESFALMTSRVRLHQDYKFSELNSALLNALFPHVSAPIPSCSIVEFQPMSTIKTVSIIPRNELLETKPVPDAPLTFTTCYQTKVLPLILNQVSVAESAKRGKGCLKFTISSIDPELTITKINPQTLRLYINESMSVAESIYEYLLKNCMAISLGGQLFTNTQELITAVGFAEQEALLPWPLASNPANRLLVEYFAFKPKFLFIDLVIPKTVNLEHHQLEIECYFSESIPTSWQYVTDNSLLLNCTPVINVFEKNCEPCLVDGKQLEYPLLIDKRHPDLYQLHSVFSVDDISDEKNPQPLPRLGGQDQRLTNKQAWHVRSRAALLDNQQHQYWLSLAETPDNPSAVLLDINAFVTNGQLPSRLNLTHQQAQLQFKNGKFPIEKMSFKLQPTPMMQKQTTDAEQDLLWELHCNQLNLSDTDQATTYLKNLLQVSSVYNEKTISDSINSVVPKQVLLRSNNSLLAPFQYGLQLTVTLDKNHLTSLSQYLLEQLLEKSVRLDAQFNNQIVWEFNYAD